jgi:hypothetical protein
VRRAAAVVLLTLALGGCLSASWWPLRPAAILLARADRAADELRFRQALAQYDEFLALYPEDPEAARALKSRDTVAAIVITRDELARLRDTLRAREGEVGKLREEVARLRQELVSRQAESDKLRADLELIKQMDLRLERRDPATTKDKTR